MFNQLNMAMLLVTWLMKFMLMLISMLMLRLLLMLISILTWTRIILIICFDYLISTRLQARDVLPANLCKELWQRWPALHRDRTRAAATGISIFQSLGLLLKLLFRFCTILVQRRISRWNNLRYWMFHPMMVCLTHHHLNRMKWTSMNGLFSGQDERPS